MSPDSIKPINSAVRDAEKVVIAALLQNVINPHRENLTGFEFSSTEYRDITMGCLVLTGDGSLVDVIALSDYLSANKESYSDIVPNPTILANLAQHPLPANVRPAILVLHKHRARTKLAQLSASLSAWATDYTDEPLDILDRVSEQVNVLRSNLGQDTVNYKHLSDISPVVGAQYDDMVKGISHNIPTGIDRIDNVTAGGGAPGDVWILGAPTGMGKSALALAIAKSQAEQGIPSLFISREMLDTENYKRLHSSVSGVPYYLMRPGMHDITHQRLMGTMAQVDQYPMWVDSESSDIRTIARSIEDAVKHHNVRSVYVDYLQLIKAANKQQRFEEITHVSKTLKGLAMEHRLWILALAQYNRTVGATGEAENSSFDGSSQIEKDASVILHLSLAKVADGSPIPKWRKATIRMGKARNAPNQYLDYWFRGETFTFAERVPDEG